jgi:hypothetical protein
MVLGDFLKRWIAPLQQRSRMACMYTGPNDCCRITCGPGTDFTRAELEVAIRGMTGDTFSLETLVLPSGVKSLCEDQALRSSVLASMPTLDEVSGSPAPLLTTNNAPTKVPGGPATGVRPLPEGERRRCQCRSTVTRTMWVPPQPGGTTRCRGRPPRGAAKQRGPRPGGSSVVMAPSWGSRPPSAKRQRRRRDRAELHHLRRNASSRRGGWRRCGDLLGAIDSSAATDDGHPATPPPPSEPRPQTPPPPPGAPATGDLHQKSGGSSAGKGVPPIARGGWEWYDFV